MKNQQKPQRKVQKGKKPAETSTEDPKGEKPAETSTKGSKGKKPAELNGRYLKQAAKVSSFKTHEKMIQRRHINKTPRT